MSATASFSIKASRITDEVRHELKFKVTHDYRVSEAQKKIRARIGKQQTAIQRQEREEKKRLQNEEVNSIIHSIRHWLLKDVRFFVATMEALDISLLESGGQKKKSLQNTHVGKGRSRRGTTTKDPAESFLNGNHPMQMLIDQYRQLYFDSIPDFEAHMQRNGNEFLIRNNILHQLKKTGFSDPQWSRRFRQVRGYQLHQDGLMRNLAKQQVDLQRQKHAVKTAKQELKELESLDRLMSNAGENMLYGHGNRRRRRRQEQPPPSTEPANQQASSQAEVAPQPISFLQQAWNTVSSLWGAEPTSTTTSTAVANSSTAIREKPRMKEKEQETTTTSDKTVKSSGLQKRILRKQASLRSLEGQVEDTASKLLGMEQKIKSMEVPLAPDEYKSAQETVARIRDVICAEHARYIQDRHAHLIAQYESLNAKTDLTKPQEWFPYARLDRRKIIFHGGPTNSGKTYSALQRLMEAESGLYLGPLRLLAAEIYETLTAEGIYTNLFTGQERREIAFSTHTSATVEMFNAKNEYDVVVLDEIQMVADPARGAAWTRALLGLRCKEIHVCGGLEARNIVEKIANACGDEFELHTYDRFTELQVAKRGLAHDPNKKGAYSNVLPGDCVVAFSRNDIFAIKREIENTTKYKCCVIYGKLPPQTRADQARRFNDPDSGYDILVASDAIGMGLNLNIKRIIFNSIFKFNGDKIIRLSHSEVKQISGRAGRRNSPYPLGEVSCRDPRDLQYIRACLSTDIEPIEKAGLLPTAAHVELFSDAMSAYDVDNEEDTFADLHQILRQFNAMATVKGDYFLGRQSEMKLIAKRLKNVPLNIRDAYNMCLSPVTEGSLDLLESFAWKYSRGEVAGLPSRSVPKRAKSFDDLSYLCGIYGDADLFLWLGLKFPPSNAVEQAAAVARKEKTLEYINEALANSESLQLNHCYLKTATRLRKSWEAENGRSRDVGLYDLDEDGDENEEDEDDDYFLEENREAVY